MRISDWSSDVCSSDLVDSPMSNVGMIARQFLPKGARVLPITAEAAADYRAAGKAADARLADLQWPPDLVWLSVGEDGHAASIFPGPDPIGRASLRVRGRQ